AYTNDVIRVVTGNGGGFGDPKERDQTLVAQDIRNGVLSLERARSVYGYQG
ncbi:hypothetical protein HBA91_18595, partial [Ochrobactrum sp. MR34]|nr:hypothetical protein [Ochrobactrum sp. MR34]